MDSVLLDVRYAFRRLRGSPGFTAAAILTLALGIGATAATFSIVDATVLEPLPFPESGRLVRLREVTPEGNPFPFSEPDFLDYAASFRTLRGLAAMKPVQTTLTGAGEPQRVEGSAVSSSLFPVLGIQVARGRAFTDRDDREGGPRVALVSPALARRLGGPDAVDRVVRLDGPPVTIVGVLPVGAAFPPGDLWLPLRASADADRTDKWLDVIGRLAPGATLADAQAEATVIATDLARAHPSARGWRAQVVPLADWLIGPGLRRMVWVLLGAVALLLVLACANVGGLLLARAVARRGEMGVRAALGAGRTRLVRQLMTENLLLSAIGGGIGVLIAFWMLDASAPLLDGVLPLGRVARIDFSVLAVTAAVVLAAALGFGLAPALHAAGGDLQSSLRPAARRSTPDGRRWADALVGVQVAIAMLLLVGACLLMGSLARLLRVDPGFDVREIVTVPLRLPAPAYAEEARPIFFRDALARLDALPSIESASATATNPFKEWGFANDVTPEDRAADAPPGGLLQAGWRAVTPGFFDTLKIPVLRGRTFTSADRADAMPVAVISDSLARRLWPGRDAVGRRVYWGGVDGEPRTVVGVVADIRDVRLDADPTPTMYLAYEQLPLDSMTLLLRTRPGAAGVAADVRRTLHAIDPALPVPDVRPLEANRAAAISAPRFRTLLLVLFGGVALLLAAIGLYAVVAFTVAQRTREIAIRIAVGAQPRQVVRLFFRRGVWLTCVGGAIGLAAAWMLTGVLRSLLYQIDARDPRMFALAAALLAAITLLASYLPARRAARFDPVEALSREQL
jgi:predicted permease